jgi:hypothetical protein
MSGYFTKIMRLLREPRRFFAEGGDAGPPGPTAFLGLSSALSAVAGLLAVAQPGNLILGAILFANAFGMALLAAGLGYCVALPLAGRRVTFGRFFSVYAHSSGVTLLLSWNPAMLLFTEPLKWWLVWTGMRAGCGLARGQAAVVLVLSLGMILALFWTLLPLTAP